MKERLIYILAFSQMPVFLWNASCVLHLVQMSHTLTIRLTEELMAWLKDTAKRTGVPVGRIIRQQLETARAEKGSQRFLRRAGEMSGPPDLSSRKGFSRR